ncbi:hypothetical protein [Bremerella cremea]|uniref:hypothetical protein n=1 Tax=Bremerella cremea TaxID=1031537 RepID=UPI0031EF2155
MAKWFGWVGMILVWGLAGGAVLADEVADALAELTPPLPIESISATIDLQRLTCVESCPTLDKMIQAVDQHAPFDSPQQIETLFASLIPPKSEIEAPVFFLNQRNMIVLSDRTATSNSHIGLTGDMKTIVQNRQHTIDHNKFFVDDQTHETILVYRNRTSYMLEGLNNLLPQVEAFKEHAQQLKAGLQLQKDKDKGERTLFVRPEEGHFKSRSITLDAQGNVLRHVTDSGSSIDQTFWAGYHKVGLYELPTIQLRMCLFRNSKDGSFNHGRLEMIRLKDAEAKHISLKEKDFAVSASKGALIQLFEPGQKEKRIILPQDVSDLMSKIDSLETLQASSD